MTEWTNKVWGRTRCTVESDFYSLHELEVKAGGFCSVHYHEQRANRFLVRSGRITVVSFYAWMTRSVTLTEDEVYDVPSMVPHMFLVRDYGIVLEEYFADRGGRVHNSDIVRLIQGGHIDDGYSEVTPFYAQVLHDFQEALKS
jgi:hypothetical protein